jgi:hypothetical protein
MSRRIEGFEYRGFHGCKCSCDLEIVERSDGRTLVITTEREDNPGTSITNVAEHLASYVCDCFGIEPEKLIWIEHYGYPDPLHPKRPRTYDLVTFERQPPEQILWSPAVLSSKPDGWPGYFDEPEWQPMEEETWREFGIEPRR